MAGSMMERQATACTKIPYSKGKIPSQAKVKVWPSLEINGTILVWYDAEGRDPNWFPIEFEMIMSGRWLYHGCSIHFINTHIEVSSLYLCRGCDNYSSTSHLQTECSSILSTLRPFYSFYM